MSPKPSVPVSSLFRLASAVLAITAPFSCVFSPTVTSNPPLTYYIRCPSINLRGYWLEETGFETVQPVKVMVEREQLIIRLAEV
jgi:hypothetical protein